MWKMIKMTMIVSNVKKKLDFIYDKKVQGEGL